MAVAAAWTGQPQWRILDTAFGDGLNFLGAWRAWKDDPQRPRILHYVAISESPASAADLSQAAPSRPELAALVQALAGQWNGLLPGVHRLVFEHGQVLLTLCVGELEKMLRQQDFHADAVLLHASDGLNLKALARCCRRGTAIEVLAPAPQLAPGLKRHGFQLHDQHGASGRSGEFAPAWEPRGPRPPPPVVAGSCIVIGAGLAGAAAAASMARRGWTVQVLDAGPGPASGASGLPAGVLVPHSSPDDNLLSRLSRDGVRATLQQAQALLDPGQDFELSGVLEHHLDGTPARPTACEASAVWNRPASAQQKWLAGLETSVAADWHEKAAWIRPARLVAAWLAQPGVQVQCGAQVAKLRRDASGWQTLAADGKVLASGELVIVAAAVACQTLVEGLALQAVRGQVTWALHEGTRQLPPFPVNGDGSLIPSVPTPTGLAWLCGASFDRGDTDLAPREADQQANLERLRRLLPRFAEQLEAATPPEQLQAWTGIRCASTDRRPLVGAVGGDGLDGLWLSTAMGSRGLTFAALAGELIAALVHAEPLPLARNLARALDPARQNNRAAARASAGE
jgi:tRNA 5-methylaminomethyl-2-thiouridine biosynthesis bifunctional protein